ncbi:hypothetical protein PC129_g25413, partial [Phytophthora cactorum]
AVSIAKHAKDVQERRIRSGIRFNTTASAAQAAAAAPQGLNPDGSRIDSRSIDELLKFIEGGDQKNKTSKKRPSRGNPKRRGQATR